MLVLTRAAGESIDIDGGIRITITRIDGNRVRVGIEAPREVRVLRSEKIERSKALARRKELYEALHPETTSPGPKGGVADNVSAIPSFAADTAAKTGQSERQVRRDDHQEVDG